MKTFMPSGPSSMCSTVPTFMPRYITLSRSLRPPTSLNVTTALTLSRPCRTSTPDMTIVK